MRIVFKILLLPLVLVLTLLVCFCRAMTMFSSVLLNIAAFVFFAVSLLALWERDFFNVGFGLVMAWLFSPYGLPLMAEWIIDRVEDVKDAIAAI